MKKACPMGIMDSTEVVDNLLMISRIGAASFFLLLALVLAGLAIHALWSLIQSNESLSEVETKQDLAKLYREAEVALRAAHANGERFVGSGLAEDRAAFEASVEEVFTALTRLTVLGGQRELAFAGGILQEYATELDSLPGYLDAIEAGEEPPVEYDARAVVPVIATLLSTRQDEVDAESEDSIATFSSHLDDQVYVALAVFGLGMPIALLALFFLLQNQKKERIAEIKLASLRAISRIDSLTGVGNLRAFQEELSGATAASKRENSPVSLALLDMDHLKRVNDEKGHMEGDLLLASFGVLLQGAGWESDGGRISAYRLGGDEFALLRPGFDEGEAEVAIERLRVQGRDALSGQTFSAGVVTSRGGELAGRELQELADKRLYEAEARGRDAVVVAGVTGTAA